MLYQLLETRRSVAARGQNLSLSFQAMLASGDDSPSSLRFGIIQWTGAADTPDADIIASWPVAGADPVFTTPGSCSVLGATSQVLSAGSFVECKTEDVAVAAGATNIGIIIWSDDDTVAIGDIITISQVKLEVADQATAYLHESQQALEDATDRYFCKTFEEETAPADYASEFPGCLSLYGYITTAASTRTRWTFPVRMIGTPAVAGFNPGNASPAAGRHWYTSGGDEPELVVFESDRNCDVYVNESHSANIVYHIHLTADARFF
jgi:hypothetical protein